MESELSIISSRNIGVVEKVSPNLVSVLLDIEAPQTTAFNTGEPYGFPRLNSFVLIPNEIGQLIGLVTWIGIEKSDFPKRSGYKDFGVIDLPYPLRKISLNPLGSLKWNESLNVWDFERGISVYPSVGDVARLPSSSELEAIIASSMYGQSKNTTISIGTSTLHSNSNIYVQPDRLFGRHLAVLGNTGGGKSCTVAGLIRWSIESIKNHANIEKPNTRFIVLDPNGEYSDCFRDLGIKTTIFKVNEEDTNTKDDTEEDVETSEVLIKPLVVPAWMWNSEEWATIGRAGLGIQKPILNRSLSQIRAGGQLEDNMALPIPIYSAEIIAGLRRLLSLGPNYFTIWPGTNEFGDLVDNVAEFFHNAISAGKINQPLIDLINAVIDKAEQIKTTHRVSGKGGKVYWNHITGDTITGLLEAIDLIVQNDPPPSFTANISADSPLKFDVNKLPDWVRNIARTYGGVDQHMHTLIARIETILANPHLTNVINPQEEITFEDWLQNHIPTGSDKSDSQIHIIDLSLIPSDVIHLFIAIYSRLIFEGLQRVKSMYEEILPTVLVLEEAHTFIKSRSANTDELSMSTLCRTVFERIAREGRKFGLGLVLSSQRPYELSPTVLSQCNTYIIHRIVNDRDQELIRKLIPDSLGDLLDELPSLPTRQAILLGWATPIPMLVDINELEEKYRPKSKDPKYWDAWISTNPLKVDWKRIVSDWSGVSTDITEIAEVKESAEDATDIIVERQEKVDKSDIEDDESDDDGYMEEKDFPF